MPLTEKGEKIMEGMKERYGAEKGESVFYASKNAGTISGVDRATRDQASHPAGPIRDQDHPRTQSGDPPAPISKVPASKVARELASRGDNGPAPLSELPAGMVARELSARGDCGDGSAVGDQESHPASNAEAPAPERRNLIGESPPPHGLRPGAEKPVSESASRATEVAKAPNTGYAGRSLPLSTGNSLPPPVVKVGDASYKGQSAANRAFWDSRRRK